MSTNKTAVTEGKADKSTIKKQASKLIILALLVLSVIFAFYLQPPKKHKSTTAKENQTSLNKLKKKAFRLYQEQNYTAAVKSLNLYLKQKPSDLQARKMLAESYEQLNLISLALAQYRLILRKSPSSETLYQAAILLRLQKKPQEALSLLTKAEKKEPDNILIKVELAKTYAQAGKIEAAEKQWQEVIASLAPNDPYKPIAYAELGDVLKQGGQLQKAKDAYEAGLKLEPTNEYLKQQVASLAN